MSQVLAAKAVVELVFEVVSGPSLLIYRVAQKVSHYQESSNCIKTVGDARFFIMLSIK